MPGIYNKENYCRISKLMLKDKRPYSLTSCHNSIQPETLESFFFFPSLSPLLPTQSVNSQSLFLFFNPLLCQSTPLWRSESWKVSETN